jgi:hypothetical protein
MASITVRHTWADSSVVEVRVNVDASYPDAIDEARVNARRLLREVVADLNDEVEPDAEAG